MSNTEETTELQNEVPVTEETVSVEAASTETEKPKYAAGQNTISHFASSLGFIPEAIERFLVEKKFQFSRDEKLATGAFKLIKDNLEIISKNDKDIKVEMHKAFVASEKERKKKEAKEKKERQKAEGKKPAKSKKAKAEEAALEIHSDEEVKVSETI